MNSYPFPIASKNFTKSVVLMTHVPVFSLGWKLIYSRSSRFLSLRVVNDAEGGDAARFQAEIFVHARLRGEAELALFQTMLQIVDGKLLHAVENHQIMAVSLVIPEKQVLAVRPLELAPVTQRVFNGR